MVQADQQHRSQSQKNKKLKRNRQCKYNKLFSENYDYNITDEQIDFVNYYWGLTDKRSPEELYRILYELQFF